MLVETHIHFTHHLYDNTFQCIASDQYKFCILELNRDQLIEKINDGDIAFCVEPGIDLASNYRLLKLADTYKGFIYPAVGIHPSRCGQTEWKARKEIKKLSKEKSVVAIGELGLDYHMQPDKKECLKQAIWFVWQLLLANRRKLPVILHIRMADEDAIKILRRFKRKLHGGVVHCFWQGPEIAKIYTEELGLMLGIGGSLLQNDKGQLEETVKLIPLEYMVLETDGPYVLPKKPDTIAGKRWKKARNTSLILPHVAEKIAQIKGVDIEQVEKITSENAMRLFGVANE